MLLVLVDMDARRLNGVHFVSHLFAIRCLLITNNRIVTTFDNICELKNIYIATSSKNEYDPVIHGSPGMCIFHL